MTILHDVSLFFAYTSSIDIEFDINDTLNIQYTIVKKCTMITIYYIQYSRLESSGYNYIF